jgi:putative colanic acid biosynthesis acetyltransferase WcaF
MRQVYLMDLQHYSVAQFDRGASRFKEAVWFLVRGLLFLPAFPLPSSLRCVALRLFGAKIGRGVVIRSRVNITFPWRLEVGDHVWVGEEVLILSLAPVRIGSNVCLSQRVFLCTGSHNFRSDAFSLITKPIVVEQHTWVAAQAFVAPGVTVGPRSVVSAGSVVLRDVPANTIVRGNPAVEVGSTSGSECPQSLLTP